MRAALEQALPFTFLVLWPGGTIALFFWARAKTSEYARHFPPVDGVPLDMYYYRPREPGQERLQHAGRKVMLEVQEDSALEALRIAMWKRYGYTLLWGLGFPILVGILVLLS